MAQAPTYERETGFADDQANNAGGRSTVRTAQLDAELDAISASINALQANQELNQRDDGEIRDQRVKVHTLAADVLALLTSYGATPRGDWATATTYALKDLVRFTDTNTYICVTAHTSGVFATDLAAGRWLLFTLGTAIGAGAVAFAPTGTIAATNVQAAINESDTEVRALVVAEAGLRAAADLAIASTLAASSGSGGVGFTQGVTGDIDTDVETVLRETISATRMGAVADGDGAGGGTDNYAAFTAALAAITATGKPGVLRIPPGTYRCDTALVVDVSLVSIIADGAFIDFSNAAVNARCITFRGDGLGYAGSTYYAGTNFVQGLRIKGRQGASEGAYPVAGQEITGLYFDKGTTNILFGVELRNMVLSNFTNAIELGDEAWGITFRNVNTFFCQRNYYAPATTAAGAKMVFDTCILGNGSQGIVHENPNASLVLKACNIDGMQSDFIYITAGKISVDSCHIETGNSDTASYVVRRPTGVNPSVYGHVHFSNTTIIVKGARTVPIVEFSNPMEFSMHGGEINSTSATHATQMFDSVGGTGVGTLTILGTNLTKAGGDTVFGMSSTVELNAIWNNVNQPNRISFLYGPTTTGTSVSREFAAYDRGTFTPTPSVLTVVGGPPTYTGFYIRKGDEVTGTIHITNTGGSTTASTANATYFSGLPYTPIRRDVAYVVTASTGSGGNGLVDTTGRIYTPTWAADGTDRIISFRYAVA